MIKQGNVYLPCGTNLPPEVISIKNGGTSSTSRDQFINKLNAISKTSMNVPGGIAGGKNGYISSEVISRDDIRRARAKLVTDHVGTKLAINQTITYTIENYFPDIDYGVPTATVGTISREDNVITYTAPSTPGKVTINFVHIQLTLDIVATNIETPVIVSPANNSTGIDINLMVTSSDFKVLFGIDPVTHASSTWELSTDQNFNNIIKTSVDSATDLNTYSINGLSVDSEYYVRVKYKGSNNLWSDWSEVSKFRTVKPGIDNPTLTTTNVSIYGATLKGSTYTVSNSGGVTYTHDSSDWQVSTSPDFTVLVVNQTADATNKTTYAVSGLNMGTTYYARVRYYNATLGYTDWSGTSTFTTLTASIKQPVAAYNSITNTTVVLTSSAYDVINSNSTTFPHLSTDWQVSTDTSFTGLVVNVSGDTTNKTSYTVKGLSKNTTYYVRVRHNNSVLASSTWSATVSFTTDNVSIVTPSITSPSNGSTLGSSYATSVSLVASAYSLTSSNSTAYPHTGSDWQISTNSSFTNIVKSLTNDSANKTAWTATGLTKDTTYYARVRYYNANTGYSSWSSTISFRTNIGAIVDASGRTFARHSSGMGTVMTWKDKSGVTHKTLVLDATYRTKLQWGSYQNYSNMTDYKNNNNYYYFVTGTNSSTGHNAADWQSAATESAFLGAKKTDAVINSWSGYFEDAKSSKQETDLMMAVNSSTSYAAGFCRSKTVNGVKCDLPNIQTLVRIYCSMFQLDSLDPTATGNKYLFTKTRSGLTYNWGFDGAYTAWSSTEWGASGSYQYAWVVYCNGHAYWHSKNYTYWVVPVLEITE